MLKMKMWCRVIVIFVIVGSLYASHIVQEQGPCNFYDTVNITSGHLDQQGNFHHQGIVYRKGTFQEYDYIIKNYTLQVKVDVHMRGCICAFKPCIRLCCTDVASPCIEGKTITVPTEDDEEVEIDLTSKSYGVLEGKPCFQMYQLEPNSYDYDRWFFSNGSVQLVGDGKVVDQRDYCFSQENSTTQVLLCFYSETDVRLTLYPIGMIFSLPFLFITFCVYGFIPELRNLHGKSLMCYVFSLTILYISLSVVQLEGNTFSLESIPCITSGYMTYISVLLCFFWLNVMCWDIWLTFRGIRGRSGDRKRFLFYCLYAFGVPIFLTGVVFFIDYIVPSEYDVFKPLMGIHRCWIQKSDRVEAVYIYTPISIILIVNIVLYSITAYKIYKVQKETSVIRTGESQKHSKVDADKDRFFLYLRLFIIMGSTWCMESVSWIIDSPYIFYVSDLLNCLQGFIIFILFVWKPKVKKLIVRRYRSIRKLPPTASQNHSAGSMRTETSRISSGIHSGIKCQEKPMLDE